jgi:ankyrin repeat protein
VYSATSSGYMDVVSLLVHYGANINIRHHDGWTPLHVAVYNKYYEIVLFLLQHGASINYSDKVSECLSNSTNMISVITQHGWTALHIAAYNGHVDLVSMLLKHDADIRCFDKVYSKFSAVFNYVVCNSLVRLLLI